MLIISRPTAKEVKSSIDAKGHKRFFSALFSTSGESINIKWPYSVKCSPHRAFLAVSRRHL